MEKITLNNTPVRTSKSFGINNIKLENVIIPEKINEYQNLKIQNENSNVLITEDVENFDITYGVGKDLVEQVKNNSNKKLKIEINGKNEEPVILDFKLDENNKELVENISIIADEGSKADITIKFSQDTKSACYHNGILNIVAKENSNLNINLINLLGDITNNFHTIENNIDYKANVKYTIIDFGGKNSITNYYSNITGKNGKNSVYTAYLGGKDNTLDLNYIAELKGEQSKVKFEVQGALTYNARKHFKGTIDFKRGCKKAVGSENEFCMLLSEKAKSLALPMLLCSEEDVEGEHSCAAGKIEPKELFYLMSRGINKKDAMKLMVRAKFNKIIEKIKIEKLKQEIIDEIDRRLEE